MSEEKESPLPSSVNKCTPQSKEGRGDCKTKVRMKAEIMSSESANSTKDDDNVDMKNIWLSVVWDIL